MAVRNTYDEGVTLAGVDLDGVDREGLVVDGVGLDDGHVVAVNGEDIVGVARQREKTHTVAESTVSNGTVSTVEGITNRLPCSTVITARSVLSPPAKRPNPLIRVESEPILNVLQLDPVLTPCAGVNLREGSTERSGGVIPIRERDDRGLVVDVVKVRMRVTRVVYDHRAAQTIAVLRRQVTVVPEGACGCGVLAADYGRT